MSPYRKLARSYRHLARVNLWLLTPLCIVVATLNAATALDQPIRWVLAGMFLLLAAVSAYASRAHRRTAQSYENTAAAQDKANGAWANYENALEAKEIR